MYFLAWVNQTRDAAIELVRHIEQMLGEVVRRHARQQHTADMEVEIGTLIFRNQRIGRLLDSVVQKPAGAFMAEDEAAADSFREACAQRLLCCPVNQSQGRCVRDIAQTRELFEGFLGGGRKPLQLLHHKIHDVFGEAFGVDATNVPVPSLRDWIECEHPLFGQCQEELYCEERISAGFLLHQLRQGLHMLRRAMKGIGHEVADLVESERRQHYFLDPRSGLADRLQRARKRVRGTNFIVSVGADQQQVP